MLKQEPLPTHDGRPGNRGSIVNIASQLGVVSRPNARKYFSWVGEPHWLQGAIANMTQLHIVLQKQPSSQ